MESIQLDGKKYIKASTIAKELGYTADYVGQLCRANKVDSQLVGRSWYAEEASIRAHKKNRQRSSKAYSIRTLEDTAAELRETKHKPAFYVHAERTGNITYLPDDGSLLPVPTREKAGAAMAPAAMLDVELADAKPVSVRTNSEERVLEMISRPDPIFQGDIVIESIDEPQVEDEQDEVEDDTAENDIDDDESDSKEPAARKVSIRNIEGSLALTRTSLKENVLHKKHQPANQLIVTSEDNTEIRQFRVQDEHSQPTEHGYREESVVAKREVSMATTLLAAIVFSVICVLGMLSVTHVSVFGESSVATSNSGYSFDTDALMSLFRFEK